MNDDYNIPKNAEHLEALIESRRQEMNAYIETLPDAKQEILKETQALSDKMYAAGVLHFFMTDATDAKELYDFIVMYYALKGQHENPMAQGAVEQHENFLSAMCQMLQEFLEKSNIDTCFIQRFAMEGVVMMDKLESKNFSKLYGKCEEQEDGPEKDYDDYEDPEDGEPL